MKKTTLLGGLIAIVAFAGMALVGSCVKTDGVNCTSSSESPVKSVTGADSTKVNVADTLLVSFLISNSCGKSAKFNPAVATTGTNVHIMTTYEGCACSDVIIQVNQKYVFKAPNPGTYTLSFWGGDATTILEKTIVVTP